MTKSRKCQELEQELAALKAHLREMSASRAESPESKPTGSATEARAEPPAAPPLDFDALVAAMKQEVEELDPLTCLAIFGLGVLTGRLLSA